MTKEFGFTKGRSMRKLPYQIRISKDFVPLYTGAGIQYVKIGLVSDRDLPVIVEECQGKGASLWGKLQSGAGWIPLDDTSVVDDKGPYERWNQKREM